MFKNKKSWLKESGGKTNEQIGKEKIGGKLEWRRRTQTFCLEPRDLTNKS